MVETTTPAAGQGSMVTAEVLSCSGCGAAVPARSKFCPRCGAWLPGSQTEGGHVAPRAAGDGRHRSCRNCNAAADPTAQFCTRCGCVLDGTATVGPADGVGHVLAAGWYPDPFERFDHRWWDGTNWSAYASSGAVQWDPLSFDDAFDRRSPGLPALGTAIVGFVAGVVLSFAIDRALVAFGQPGGRAGLLVLTELGLWAGLLGACALVSFRRGSGSLISDFGLRARWPDLGFGVAGAFAGRIAAASTALPVVAAFPHLSHNQNAVFGRPHGALLWTALVLVVCIGAPVVEELFFRGLLQSRLVGRLGTVWGVVITSVLFAAAHLMDWVGPVTVVYVSGILGGGLVLGTLRQLTGRLGTSIAAHCVFNAQALIFLALIH